MTDDEFAKLIEGSKPITSAPVLRTINGMGFRLSGWLKIPGADGRYVAAYWLVFFFMPLIPLAVYVVKGAPGGRYSFLRKLRFTSVVRAYGWGSLRLYASAWFEGGVAIVVAAIVVGCLIAVFWGLGRVFNGR